MATFGMGLKLKAKARAARSRVLARISEKESLSRAAEDTQRVLTREDSDMNLMNEVRPAARPSRAPLPTCTTLRQRSDATPHDGLGR